MRKVAAFGVALVAVFALSTVPNSRAATDSVDEIHYSYGDDATSVVFDWHGAEQTIYYGPDSTYGMQAVAGDPPYLPTDEPGPFREVTLSDLSPGTTYHYMIGADGVDHTFATAPTGDYTSVDTGDTMSSSCPKPDTSVYMPQMQQLIAAQDPYFVTHGGDIAIANQCGQQAIHRYYTDIQAWSLTSALQVAFGNHEYGPPTTSPLAPPGTPYDSLANYKGRDRLSNAQTTPNDTAATTTHPGCGDENANVVRVNTCQGDDWGYFTAGHVFYIAYPEPDTGPNLPSMTAWEQAASALMAGAQADPNIDFIVTFGHRTAFTDSGTGAVPATHDALVALAAIYSPAPGNTYGMYGKYVVNIQHDAHNMEAFAPNPNDNKHGLTYITDAAGGQGMTNWVTKIDPDSVFRMRHLGILVSRYDAAARTLSFSFVCGSHSSASEDPCNYGSTLWSTSFTAAPPAVATVATTMTGADKMLPIGGQTTFTATVRNPAPGTSVAGASLSVSVPDGMSILSADPGADISGNVATWPATDLVGGASSTVEHVVAQVDSGDPGSTPAVSATVATADTSCGLPMSNCSAISSITIGPPPPPPPTQWVKNPSVESGLTGWTGLYNKTSKTSRVAGGQDGSYAVRSVNNSAGAAANGIADKPHWIDGTPGKATVAGKVYTASAWVKADTVGQKIVLFLRETNSAGKLKNVAPNTVGTTVVAKNTGWFPISVAYPAAASGDSLAFQLHCAKSAAHQGFTADSFSLTSS